MKKSHENYILWGLLILLLIGMAFLFSLTYFSGNAQGAVTAAKATSNQKTTSVQETANFKSIDSGSTDTGDVSVELTPLEITENALRVNIAANTHSVDLSQFDLKQITTLEYNGKFINPISAPNLVGHHANGELLFKVDEKPASFTITIKGIPKVEERVFEWSLNN